MHPRRDFWLKKEETLVFKEKIIAQHLMTKQVAAVFRLVRQAVLAFDAGTAIFFVCVGTGIRQERLRIIYKKKQLKKY